MAVYYVSEAGMVTGDGSEANPFATVAAAEAVAKPGDKIVDGAKQWRVRGPGRTPAVASAPAPASPAPANPKVAKAAKASDEDDFQ